MADDDAGPSIIQDSDVSKFDKINFHMTLQIHLIRISQMRSTMTTAGNIDEKILTYNEQVEFLEDVLNGYFDEVYNSEIKRVESYTVDPIEFEPSQDGSNIYVTDKIAAMKYIRQKFQALMRLMARKNLLLQEDAVGVI